MDTSSLLETQKILLAQFKAQTLYHRQVFDSISLDNYVTGIVGSRGIGKTTLLLYHALKQGALAGKALYASLDHVFFVNNKLLDLVDQLYKETDVRLLCLDEIHKHEHWTQALKNIADTYQDFRILFSGSSTIDLLHGKYDLSRRVTLVRLQGLSFREYLEFQLGTTLPSITLPDLLKDHQTFAQTLDLPDILKQFNQYLRVGYYPFFKNLPNDWEKFQAIEHTTQKTIYEDIALFKSLKTPTLMLIEKLYKYVLISAPGELSVAKLASTLGKDFDNISDYLALLEQAGLIRFLWPKQAGKAALRNPTKIYPENSNLLHVSHLSPPQDQWLGKVRETFALNQLHNAGLEVFCPAAGDFQVGDWVFEIGGKNKTRAQLKQVENAWLLKEGVLVGSKGCVPLYLLGFLRS